MTRNRFKWLACASGLALAGCLGASDATDEAIVTTPSSLAEGAAQLAKLERIIAERGASPELREKQRLVRDHMDVLNGLVDRLDVAPNHTINVFVTADGTTIVGERMQMGMRSVLGGTESIDALYRRLAPGRTVPEGLATMRIVAADQAVGQAAAESGGGARLSPSSSATQPSADGTAVVRSALTDSPADDLYFRNNFCKTNGVWWDCVIDWSGGRSSQATSDHSITHTAFTVGTGHITIALGNSSSVTWSNAILPGELQTWWAKGPTISVRNHDCGCCSACQSHYEAKRIFMRWQVLDAANKVFNFASLFYNAPHNWNGP